MIKSKVIRLINSLIIFTVSLLLFGCVGTPQYNLISNGVVADDFNRVVAEGQTYNLESMPASQRVASIADLMDGIKNSKTPDWLIRELGQPDGAIPLEQGHAEWSWRNEVRELGRKRYACQQQFYVNTQQNKITGWATDCPAGNYGTVAQNAPIIPANGKILKRAETFTDYLATRENYREITYKYPELTPEPVVMADGKKKMVFTKNWHTQTRVAGGGSMACMGIICSGGPSYSYVTELHTCKWSVTVDHAGTIIGWDTSQCNLEKDEEDYGDISTLIPVPPRRK